MLSEFSDQTCRLKLNEKSDGFGILQVSFGIPLEFFKNSSGILQKLGIGIPIRKSAGFPNMFCFTYFYYTVSILIYPAFMTVLDNKIESKHSIHYSLLYTSTWYQGTFHTFSGNRISICRVGGYYPLKLVFKE